MNTTGKSSKIPPSEDETTSPKIPNANQIKDRFTEQDIDNQKSENRVFFLKWVRWIMPVLFTFFILIFCSSVLVWAIHYLTSYSWLKPEQLDKIESVIFSGSIGAVVGISFKTYLEKQLP